MGALGVAAVTSQPADAREPQLVVDVASNGTTIAFAGNTDPSGNPVNGTFFVIEGYIYPPNTLTPGAGGGVLPSGEPEFPALVIGTWFCSGTFVRRALASTNGIVAFTNQIFDLDLGAPGSKTLVTVGFEQAEAQSKRAVTGGTGRYARSNGQVTQFGYGPNITGAFNYQEAFSLTLI